MARIIFINPISYLSTALSFIFVIFSSLGFYLTPFPLYAFTVVIFALILLWCSLIVYHDKAGPNKWHYITSVLMILIISITNNPVIIIPSLILFSLVVKKFFKNRKILISVILIIAFFVGLRTLGFKISIRDNNVIFSKSSDYVYCDTSPDGKKVLSETVQSLDNINLINYYITHSYGILERRYLLLTIGTEDNEHYFTSDNMVKIQGKKYSIK